MFWSVTPVSLAWWALSSRADLLLQGSLQLPGTLGPAAHLLRYHFPQVQRTGQSPGLVPRSSLTTSSEQVRRNSVTPTFQILQLRLTEKNLGVPESECPNSSHGRPHTIDSGMFILQTKCVPVKGSLCERARAPDFTAQAHVQTASPPSSHVLAAVV